LPARRAASDRTLIRLERGCAVNFRFSSIPGWKEEAKGNVSLDGRRNRRLIGSSESQNAPESDPARPDPGSRVAMSIPSEGWKRASVPVGVRDGLGVPPRSLVIHEAPLEIERHNEALPRVAVAIDCLPVASTNTLAYPISRATRIADRAPLDRPWLRRCGRRWTMDANARICGRRFGDTTRCGSRARLRSEKRKEKMGLAMDSGWIDFIC